MYLLPALLIPAVQATIVGPMKSIPHISIGQIALINTSPADGPGIG